MTELHLCIATGQSAANLIPLKQLLAQEVWILETPAMKAQRSGADLKQALDPYVPAVKCIAFDDSTPQAICAAAAKLANVALDGRDVVLHITGGTKLMVLAIHQELSYLNAGTGSYRTTNDTRPAKDQQIAAARATVSRHMGEQAHDLRGFFSTLAYRASLASEGNGMTQQFDYPPGGPAAKLLNLAVKNNLLKWTTGHCEVTFQIAIAPDFSLAPGLRNTCS